MTNAVKNLITEQEYQKLLDEQYARITDLSEIINIPPFLIKTIENKSLLNIEDRTCLWSHLMHIKGRINFLLEESLKIPILKESLNIPILSEVIENKKV